MQTLSAFGSTYFQRTTDFPQLEAVVRRCAVTVRRASIASASQSKAGDVSDEQEATGNSHRRASAWSFVKSDEFFGGARRGAEYWNRRHTDGIPKALPSDVHLPLPMFYDKSSEIDSQASTTFLRLPTLHQQSDGVLPQQQRGPQGHYQQEGVALQGGTQTQYERRDATPLQRTVEDFPDPESLKKCPASKLSHVQAEDVCQAEEAIVFLESSSSSPVTATLVREAAAPQRNGADSAQISISATMHHGRTRFVGKPLSRLHAETSQALFENSADAVSSTTEASSGRRTSASSKDGRHEKDIDSIKDASEQVAVLLRSRQPQPITEDCHSNVRCREHSAAECELHGASAWELSASSTAHQKQQQGGGRLTVEGSQVAEKKLQRRGSDEPAAVSSKRRQRLAVKWYSQAEARALQAAAQILPGRVDASVAAAMLQACADANHRNIVLLSCLIASLKTAISHAQATMPSESAEGCVRNDAGLARRTEDNTAVILGAPCARTASLLVGGRCCQKADGNPWSTVDKCIRPLDKGSHESAQLSRSFSRTSEALNATVHASESWLASKTLSRSPERESEPFYSNITNEKGPFLTHSVESMMKGKTLADVTNQTLARRVFAVGLHEIQGLVYRPQRVLTPSVDCGSNSNTRTSYSTTPGRSTATTGTSSEPHSVRIESEIHADPALLDTAPSSTDASPRGHWGIGAHPSATHRETMPLCNAVSAREASDRCSIAGSEQGGASTNTSGESSNRSKAQADDDRAKNIISPAFSVDERQMQDLQQLAVDVRWGAVRVAGTPAPSTATIDAVHLSARPPVLQKPAAAASDCPLFNASPAAICKRSHAQTGESQTAGTATSSGLRAPIVATQKSRDGCSSSVRDIAHTLQHGENSHLLAHDVSVGADETCGDRIHEGVYERAKPPMTLTTQKRDTTSGLMRFRYNKAFFQKLRQAAMLSQGSKYELEELKASESLRESSWLPTQLPRRQTARHPKMSKGGRITRMATVIPPDSHVERRVSAEERRQRFWERLLKGKHHPQARRLLHRRYFRMSCRLRTLNSFLEASRYTGSPQDYTVLANSENSSVADDEDPVRQSDMETARHHFHRRIVDRRLARNYYRPAQVLRHTMARWSALRRCFLTPYQEHARLIQKELHKCSQQAFCNGLSAVLESTFSKHGLLSGAGRQRAACASPAPNLFMYFVSPDPSEQAACAQHVSRPPLLVDTQLLLTPEIDGRRCHWLAQSRLRCIYKRILRDNKRSQQLLIDEGQYTSRALICAAPMREVSSSDLKYPLLRAIPRKGYGEETRYAEAFVESNPGAAVCSFSRISNENHCCVAVDPDGGIERKGYHSASARDSAFPIGGHPTSMNSRPRAPPPLHDAANKNACGKVFVKWKEEYGVDAKCTRDVQRNMRMDTSDVNLQISATSGALLKRSDYISASAAEPCGPDKREVTLSGLAASHERKEGSTLSMYTGAPPSTGRLILSTVRMPQQLDFAHLPVLKRVPLLQEASSALQAVVKLRYFPAGVLRFLVEHIHWAVRLLAKDLVGRALRTQNAPAGAEGRRSAVEAGVAPSRHVSNLGSRRRLPGQTTSSQQQSTTQKCRQAEPNVGNTLSLRRRPLESSLLLTDDVTRLHLFSVLRSINAAAEAVTKALASLAKKDESTAQSSVGPPLTSLKRDVGDDEVSKTQATEMQAASPAAALMTTVIRESTHHVDLSTSGRPRSAAASDRNKRTSREEQENALARVSLSRSEAAAISSLLASCYRSLAFTPLLTAPRKSQQKSIKDDPRAMVIFEAARLYTALLQHLHGGKRRGAFSLSKCGGFVGNTSALPTTPVLVTGAQRIPPTPKSHEVANPLEKAASAERTREQLFLTACRTFSVKGYADVSSEVEDVAQMKEPEIPAGPFCAVLAKCLADILGIPISQRARVRMSATKSRSRGSPAKSARPALLEKHLRGHAEMHVASLIDPRFQRSSRAVAGDTSVENECEETEARWQIEPRLRRAGAIEGQTCIQDSADIADWAAEEICSLRRQNIPGEQAPAEQELFQCKGDAAQQRKRPAPDSLPLGSSGADTSYLCDAPIVDEQIGYNTAHKCGRVPRVVENCGLSIQQMSTLLRTAQALDEASNDKDEETAVILHTLRMALNTTLKQIISSEGHHSAQGRRVFSAVPSAAVDRYGDHASAAAEELYGLPSAARGEFRRDLLTALVTLTLDDMSREGDPAERNSEFGSSGDVDERPTQKCRSGSKGTGSCESTARHSGSGCSNKRETPVRVSGSGRIRYEPPLERAVAKLSYVAGVPPVLLRKLVERELVRREKQLARSIHE